MNTFTFKGKEYTFTDTLDLEDIHEELLTEAVNAYNRKTLTGYIQGGDKKVTHEPVLGRYMYLTAYDLDTFVRTIMNMSNDGWELHPKNLCSTYGRLSYTVTLVRTEEAMKADADIITATIPNLVTNYLAEFEEARTISVTECEKELREELSELGSIEARRRAIYRQLKQFEGVTTA